MTTDSSEVSTDTQAGVRAVSCYAQARTPSSIGSTAEQVTVESCLECEHCNAGDYCQPPAMFVRMDVAVHASDCTYVQLSTLDFMHALLSWSVHFSVFIRWL